MRKNSGLIVRTKSGEIGRTWNIRDYINGKIVVQLEKDTGSFIFDGEQVLCRPETLKIIGRID